MSWPRPSISTARSTAATSVTGPRAADPMSDGPDSVRAYLLDLQRRITSTCGEIDGKPFFEDAWKKEPGEKLQGEGITMITEGGPVFERAGCGFSHVRGPELPASATQHRPELAGSSFEAMGVSLVFHPRNPY